MWGQACIWGIFQIHSRIIPTRVGTRIYANENVMTCEDHPHAYGDKLFMLTAKNTAVGSSPRVWGQVAKFNGKNTFAGIIPTRMGTRKGVLYIFAPVGDHPHAYGDKLYSSQARCNFQGSSPRVWGQVFIGLYSAVIAGIIPTRMGTR